ncbi:hypothetical protein HYDPIDRAFT_33713 [Hydnomerulius pinastri MD-312]|uniref:Isopenicillin N synthase-like Fe(2+) 2OG dioxygenase domain-containing protein n=1 Tax=Hydnomerulius pinastri MD-312 TaxID=994086 RepID=A0A0C9W8B7_9AGAM|nr:hypothetical protein HYDPIDRAFT_33713 [Hydnomerulius pinastri MD-312]
MPVKNVGHFCALITRFGVMHVEGVEKKPYPSMSLHIPQVFIEKRYSPFPLTSDGLGIGEVDYCTSYKPSHYWTVDTENRDLDQIEYCGLDRTFTKHPHPQALRPFLPELDAFARHSHFNILHPILRIIAQSLELSEEIPVEKHNFERPGDFSEVYASEIRRKSKIQECLTEGSHGQPVGGLQILSPDGKWRWVRHIDNVLVINTGDMMDFFTGGFYKPTIHRVIQPPADQSAYDRLGAFYFTMADDDLKKGAEKNVEEEIIEGIVGKRYD